jgi:two-component system phosphate regulon sensor histidine kinase PhoR
VHQGLRDEIRRIILISVAALITGFISGEFTLCLLIAGFLYSCWLLYQTRRFYMWLEHNMESTPPDSSGIWGDIVQTLYRIRQKNLRTQHEMRTQLHRIQGFTSALRSGIIILDGKGNMSWWNESAEALMGFKKEYDLHKPIINLIRDPQFIHYFYEGKEEETVTINSPIDPYLIVQIQITPYGNNEKVVSIHDVTRLKQLEQTRKDFVANVSHELRTPLTVINGYLEPMCEDIEQIGTQWREPLEKIQNQAKRMTDLVNDLAILSRLDNAERTDRKDRVNVHSILRRISDEARQFDHQKQVNIEIKGEPFILIGSETELHSCFSNLILNAIKYSHPQQVSIEILLSMQEGIPCVTIKDDGIGIDPGHIPRLTERFYRVDSSHSRKTGGSGLGLAIVKHALQRHDGQLKIESQLGKGSSFICEFHPDRLAPPESSSVTTT